MTHITAAQVRHIGTLAKLNLTDDEVAKYTREMERILDYFTTLQAVDTTGVQPIAQVTGQENITRDDTVAPYDAMAALVACTPHAVQDGMVALPKIL
ncbi:Asp-tRNA(Asn)/Glu-tRNA(Gln) amidotransferase subunit GatC [Candidatus Peribacteria bacterium]|nr:Asp-tRNA(Asn)/Glu-tRNA(Gln) amidotransferase subunit GatC [Candidatus Peribacteria bacterium]